MKCQELLALLNEYVDGTVDPSLCDEFAQHMAGCNPCQVVVDNIRQTITLYKDGTRYDLPVQFQQRLHSTLRKSWQEKHTKGNIMTQACEMPMHNASDHDIETLLTTARNIAVVGLSDKPDRDSYRVAAYLQQQGFRIIPINPNVHEVLGEKSYASLGDVPVPVDIVDIFRKPEAVPEIVNDAIETGCAAIWMQTGIVHNPSAKIARAAGLKTIMNRCLMVEHMKLAPPTAPAT